MGVERMVPVGWWFLPMGKETLLIGKTGLSMDKPFSFMDNRTDAHEQSFCSWTKSRR